LVSAIVSFLSFNEFREMFHVNCSFIQYYGLLNVIPKSWKQEISAVDVNEDNNWSLINVLSKSERPFKLVYQTIMEHVAIEMLRKMGRYFRMCLKYQIIQNFNIFHSSLHISSFQPIPFWSK